MRSLIQVFFSIFLITSCGFFKNSLRMENSSSDSSSSGAQLASFSMSVEQSTKSLARTKSASKSLGLVQETSSGFNLASQTGALAADKFTATLTGCASGLSGVITGGTFNAYLGDSGCIVKLTSLTIHNKTYTSTASGATDFTSWSSGQLATFANAVTGETVEVLVVKQLSSAVQSSDYVSYVFSILQHNSDVTVSSSHQLLVAGQDAPNFEILNTTVDFVNNTLTFQVKCTSGLLISDGSQYTFCPSYNGASYASGAGVDIAGANNADASSLFNYALIDYDPALNLTSARTAVTSAALASPTQLGTVQSPGDLLSFSSNNNYGFQTIALHSPQALQSASPYQVILILQAKNTTNPTDINKSSFQYFAITIDSNVNNTCSSSPGLCLVGIDGGRATAQTSGGAVTNTLPDSGSTNVSVNSKFSLFFSTPTDPTSLTVMNDTNSNNGNLTMSCNNTTRTGTIIAGDNNQTVVLSMDSALPPLSACTLTLGNYSDAVGHNNISGHVYTFTTGCISDDTLNGLIDTSACYSPTWQIPELASSNITSPDLTSSFQNRAYQLDINSPTAQSFVPIAAYYKKFQADKDFTATITLKQFSGIQGGPNNDLGGDICAFEAVNTLGTNGRVALSLMNSTLYTDPSTASGSGFLSIRGIASGAETVTTAVSSDSNATGSNGIYSNYNTNPIKFQIQKVGTTFIAKYSLDGGSSFTTIQSQIIPNFSSSFYLTFGGSKYSTGSTTSCSFADLTISDDTNSSYLTAIAPQMGGQDGASVVPSASDLIILNVPSNSTPNLNSVISEDFQGHGLSYVASTNRISIDGFTFPGPPNLQIVPILNGSAYQLQGLDINNGLVCLQANSDNSLSMESCQITLAQSWYFVAGGFTYTTWYSIEVSPVTAGQYSCLTKGGYDVYLGACPFAAWRPY